MPEGSHQKKRSLAVVSAGALTRARGQAGDPSPMDSPCYYSGLKPCRSLLATGHAVLTYHHVGTAPRGVRLKGLYLSPQLFARQMAELAAAGFSAPGYDELLDSGPENGLRVFLTFDDGFGDVWEHALPVLQHQRYQAIQFLVANRLGDVSEWQRPSGEVAGSLMSRGQIEEWLAAGQGIGSHSLTHPYLTRLPLAQAREEIGGSKRMLEDLFGREIRHFCYPYGDWDPRVRDMVEEAGYRTACTTRFGGNAPPLDPLTLQRITARYTSLRWKTLRAWLRRKLSGPDQS